MMKPNNNTNKEEDGTVVVQVVQQEKANAASSQNDVRNGAGHYPATTTIDWKVDPTANDPTTKGSTATATTCSGRPPSYARATRQWQVRVSAPTKGMIKGHLVPTLQSPLVAPNTMTGLNLGAQQRLLSLELYHVGSKRRKKNQKEDTSIKKADQKSDQKQQVDPTVLQHHLRGQSLTTDDSNTSAPIQDDTTLEDGEYILVRVFKPNKNRQLVVGGQKEQQQQQQQQHQHEQPKEKTKFLAADQPIETQFVDPTTGMEWIETTMFDLDDCHILQHHKLRHVEVQFGRGDDTQVRWISFPTLDSATSFVQVVQKLSRLESQRTQQRIENYYRNNPQLQHLQQQLENERHEDNDPKKKKKATTTKPLIGSSAFSPSSLLSQQHHHHQPPQPHKIRIVVEIVSAVQLPVADLLGVSGDPYVVVHLGQHRVHTTQVLTNTLNPIWTIDSGAIFLLEATPQQFFSASSGLTFVIKNYDPIRSHSVFGIVVVTQTELLEGTGKRIEFPIEFGDFETTTTTTAATTNNHPSNDSSSTTTNTKTTATTTQSGKLYLRYRPARDHDLEFLERLQEFQQGNKFLQCAEAVLPTAIVATGQNVAKLTKLLNFLGQDGEPGVYWDEVFVPPRPPPSAGGPPHPHGRTKKTDRKGPKLLRVKPYPDPERPPEETKWLNEEQIEAESIKQSTNWTETGTGDLGKLYVEVIGCDDLPNMDAMPLVGDMIPAMNVLTGGKSDAFVCMVFEDSIVNTDVINDCLSPRWMPWSQRAFVFRIFHPSSQLMVGVFDFDTQLPGAKHDAIGRVTVDLSNFHPATLYTLYYNLYTSDLSDKRTAHGRIQLRIRVELNNARQVLVKSLQMPPPFYINVATYRDYETARFTCEGKFDTSKFDMGTMTEHVDELREYEKLIPVLREAAFTVLLWRGHFPAKIWCTGKEVLLPLHSISLFVVGVILSENYSLLPSFVLFGISWMLFSMSGNLSDDPSPWKKPFTFLDLTKAAVAGRIDPCVIEPYQNKEAIERYEAQQEEFKQQLEEEAKMEAQATKEAMEAIGKNDAELVALNAAEDVKMATKKEGKHISMNPLEPYLFPLQQQLHQLCVALRITRSFVTWQEPLACFWICIVCLVSGGIFLFVPWGFLIRWSVRLLVWSLLGPWMKFVDVFYIRKQQTEAKQAEAAFLKRKLKELKNTAESRQLKREEMTKLKHMKRYMFGKYLLELPRWKESRYVDTPLLASSAKPFAQDEATKRSIKVTDRKYGQHLSGSIIPEREMQKDTKLGTKEVSLFGLKEKQQ